MVYRSSTHGVTRGQLMPEMKRNVSMLSIIMIGRYIDSTDQFNWLQLLSSTENKKEGFIVLVAELTCTTRASRLEAGIPGV